MKKVFFGLGMLALLAGCSISSSTPNMAKTDSGLQYEILTKGEGKVANKGDAVKVHYTGWLEDGTKFDSSVDLGTPYQFVIGAGMVIRGWDEGIEGMMTGEKRKLTIPAEMGYGEYGAPPVIPGGATLIFDVELVEVL